jgi:hypothetical protein
VINPLFEKAFLYITTSCAVPLARRLTGGQAVASILQSNERSLHFLRGWMTMTGLRGALAATGLLLLVSVTAVSAQSRVQVRREVRDRLENVRDRREDVYDRREDRRDRREDLRDRLEDRVDRRHIGGPRDRIEDRLDRREDVRDRLEDRRDRREDIRDRREDRRDRRR